MKPSDQNSAPAGQGPAGSEAPRAEGMMGDAKSVTINQGGARNVSADTVTVRQGGVVGVKADRVDMTMGGIVGAQTRTVSMTASQACGILAEGAVTMNQSAAGLLASGGKVTMDQCGSGVVIASEVRAENSGTIFLVARRVSGNVKAHFGTRESIIVGAVAGAIVGMAILGLSISKRRMKR